MVKNNGERIQQLEDTVRQLLQKIEQQETGMTELKSFITDQNEKQEQQITALRQLVNDTDTKLTVETAKHERDMRAINNIRTEETTQRTNSIDITMPNFSGEENEHPKMFLKNLETYLTHKKVSIMDRIIVIENCLKGKAAKWFSMIKDTTPTEETFKQLFLKHFFSEDKQWNIFIKCTEAGKKPITNNFQEHFHLWMAELKYLDSPKLNEEQAINLITKHFPVAIQAYIQTTREKKFLNIWEKLGELENSHNNNQNEYDQQNNQDIANITKKTPSNGQVRQFTNRYNQNNQTQQFTNRYNMQQQPRNNSYQQGQNKAIQQAQQPIGNNQTSYQSMTRQTAGANTQQNQYNPKAMKHLAIYSDEDGTYEENDIMEDEKDNESKNQEWGTMDLDQPLS